MLHMSIEKTTEKIKKNKVANINISLKYGKNVKVRVYLDVMI